MQQVWEIRQIIALAMLAISSYTDVKERRIYLMPLIISATGAVAISTVSYICASVEEEAKILIYDIAIPVSIGALIIITVKLAGRHIGSGDGYLMASLGIVTGIRSDISAVVIGMVTALLFVMFLSIKNGGFRRIRRRRIPFAPFVMTGYMVVIINGI